MSCICLRQSSIYCDLIWGGWLPNTYALICGGHRIFEAYAHYAIPSPCDKIYCDACCYRPRFQACAACLKFIS